MRLCLVSASFFPAVVYGGPIVSTLKIAQELQKIGTNVFVSTTNANRPDRLDLKPNVYHEVEGTIQVKYYHDTWKERFSFPFFLKINEDIKAADVVHINYIFSLTTIFSLFWAWKYQKPTFLSPRGSLAHWILDHGLPFKRPWIHLLIRPWAKNIVWHATSEQEKGEILDIFPRAKITVIPNGISLTKIKVTSLPRVEFVRKFAPNASPEGPFILSMGRLQKKKGFDILIDAFHIILKTRPNASLIIAGEDDGEKVYLVEKIKSLGLESSVFLIGLLKGNEVYQFLGNGDVFVLPSHNENFGNVYAEALACGTPIVASTMTPWSEVEKNGCGRWVKNEPIAVAEATFDILGWKKEETQEKAKNFISPFDWQNIARSLQQEYSKSIHEK